MDITQQNVATQSVKLPNGDIINDIPVGTTKAQLAAKLIQKGYQVPDSWLAPSQSDAKPVNYGYQTPGLRGAGQMDAEMFRDMASNPAVAQELQSPTGSAFIKSAANFLTSPQRRLATSIAGGIGAIKGAFTPGETATGEGQKYADAATGFINNHLTFDPSVNINQSVQGLMSEPLQYKTAPSVDKGFRFAVLDAARGLNNIGNAAAGNGQPSLDKLPGEQNYRQQQSDLNPVAYGLGWLGGTFASSAPLGELAGLGGKALVSGIPEGAGLLGRFTKFAVPNASMGAAYGAQQTGNPVKNAGLGALVGVGIPGVMKVGGKALDLASNPETWQSIGDVVSQFSNPDAAARQTVGKIITESAANPGLKLQPSPIQGVNLTAGGQTLDPGLQSLERIIRSRNVGGVSNEAYAQNLQRNSNQAIRDNFSTAGLGDVSANIDKTSTAAHSALTDAINARSEQEQNLWSKVPASTLVSADKATMAIDNFINNQSVTNQRIIQRHAGDFIGDFKAAVSKYIDDSNGDIQIKMPFSEIKDLRTTLGQSIRDAQEARNDNAVRLLRGIDGTLLKSLGKENAFLDGGVSSKELGDAYNAARFYTYDSEKNYFPKSVQQFLRQDPANMLSSVTSSPQNLDAYLKAVSQAPDGGASGRQAVRDYLISKMVGTASGSSRGGELSNGFINGRTLQKSLDANDQILQKVFNPDEIQQIKNLADAAHRNIATEAATPRVGSNTLEKFMGNENIPGIGTVAGKYSGQANALVNWMTKDYRGKTEKLLRDTLFDPQNSELQQMLSNPTPENLAAANAFVKSEKGNISKAAAAIIQNKIVRAMASRGSMIAANKALN